MVKIKCGVFTALILFFLLFSFYPAIFELSKSDKLKDSRREFILEHNYYWPDYNLYLSKIRQGFEGKFTAREKYTSETHKGSLIQIFYVYLGQIGRLLSLDPNVSYLLGRVILGPLLLIIIALLCLHFFKKSRWSLVAFIVVVTSGSFPRLYTLDGTLRIGRFMEWWSNIDALQRITFIPHILFGQILSFFLLYLLTINQIRLISPIRLIALILFANLTGLVFPPSLITLNAVITILIFIKIINIIFTQKVSRQDLSVVFYLLSFIFLSLPSLLYLAVMTKQMPWSTLIIFHRTHPMLIPFDQYLLGTGPILILAILGAVFAIYKKDTRLLPLFFWILSTFIFAVIFTQVKEQSPLRFTQTGLYIPLGILGTYFFYQIYQIRPIRLISLIGISLYLLLSLFMMKVSLDWQINWITQRINANVPDVPYPPQTMYPLKNWMDGIKFLRNSTDHNDVVLAAVTAGNYIPAYSGNTVFFGQSNTVNYEVKESEMMKFFKGEMNLSQAKNFLERGKIKYIFYSIQEKEFNGGKELTKLYPFLKPVYNNSDVTIYSFYDPL